MNIGELLFQCDVESRELFRKFERINKKIIDSKWSKNFNEICLKENLWPTYTNDWFNKFAKTFLQCIGSSDHNL